MGRNNGTKIVFLQNVICYCIFYVLIFYMAHYHGIEPLCNIHSSRKCVYACL